MNKEVGVQRHQLVPELDGTRSIKLILILLYRLSQEMAVVMKDCTEYERKVLCDNMKSLKLILRDNSIQ